MRPIKFRGLDGLGNWVYGIPQTLSTLHLTLDCMAQYFTEQRLYGREIVFFKHETLGQFTGFKDCEGAEIFEGDKIGDWTEVDGVMVESSQTVFFCEKEGQWMLDCSLKQDRSQSYALCQELRDFKYKVIGNIHQK